MRFKDIIVGEDYLLEARGAVRVRVTAKLAVARANKVQVRYTSGERTPLDKFDDGGERSVGPGQLLMTWRDAQARWLADRHEREQVAERARDLADRIAQAAKVTGSWEGSDGWGQALTITASWSQLHELLAAVGGRAAERDAAGYADRLAAELNVAAGVRVLGGDPVQLKLGREAVSRLCEALHVGAARPSSLAQLTG